MIPPMNNPPNRLDQLRAGASLMPPAGGAPMPSSAGGRPPMTMPPPPMMAEEPPMEDDRLGELMAMEEEPMMPEEESFSTQDVATGIATSALQISGSPEQALMAVEQAADELRAMLS